VTETGLRILNSKKQELEEQAQQLRQWQGNGNTTQLQSYMNSNRSWIPFMLFSGIIDVIFFTSIFSMMGMAMNPMESQMAAESGGAADSDTGSETGGEDSGQIGGEADASGDFGGFDAGGFGDF
jgi:hypothetical protein